MTFHVPEKFRVTAGRLGSDPSFGNNGAFELTLKTPGKPRLFAIASDGAGWEHVSVSRKDRCPTWEEMCAVKDLFWDPEDAVVQFHPPRSNYVNNHPFCLHLWKPAEGSLLLPPSILVGYTT